MNSTLDYRLDMDRDYFLAAADLTRRIYWPLSVFLLNPFVIFVVVRKTTMAADCKAAYVAHHIVLMCFDVYNGLLYRMYTLAPLPIFVCTGVMCREDVSPRLLLTILAFWTIAMCVPYLFIMLRMHQRMLPSESPFRISARSQFLVLFVLCTTLVTNVFGFAAWSTESSTKSTILQGPNVQWVQSIAMNYLVLGAGPSDVGAFVYELIVLALSIAVNFAFYVFVIYHLVIKVDRTITVHSKTQKAQLRFVYSLTIQALLTALFFFSPLVMLFVLLLFDLASVTALWVPYARLIFLMLYSLPSFYHSFVFIVKSPWVLQQLRRYSLKSITEQSTVLRLA